MKLCHTFQPQMLGRSGVECSPNKGSTCTGWSGLFELGEASRSFLPLNQGEIDPSPGLQLCLSPPGCVGGSSSAQTPQEWKEFLLAPGTSPQLR